MKYQLSILVLLSCLMAACTSTTLKAPCDQYGSLCGSKIKINQW